MHTRKFVQKIKDAAEIYPDITFSRKGAVYTCVNPYYYHMVRKNWDVYNSFDGLYVDGMLLCKMIRLLWGKKVPRLSFDMSGMAKDLFEYLNGHTDKIYFIGAQEESLKKSIVNICAAYPGMHVCGCRNGYFKSEEEKEDAIRNIIDLNPDFVIVGMGSPIQERFALHLKERGYNGIVFTCGGFLHQTANNIKYYPDWVNKYNLRAFYRLYREKGLTKRLYNVLIQFPILFTWDTICSKFTKKSSKDICISRSTTSPQ